MATKAAAELARCTKLATVESEGQLLAADDGELDGALELAMAPAMAVIDDSGAVTALLDFTCEVNTKRITKEGYDKININAGEAANSTPLKKS